MQDTYTLHRQAQGHGDRSWTFVHITYSQATSQEMAWRSLSVVEGCHPWLGRKDLVTSEAVYLPKTFGCKAGGVRFEFGSI